MFVRLDNLLRSRQFFLGNASDVPIVQQAAGNDHSKENESNDEVSA
jgi:hypothetical protein